MTVPSLPESPWEGLTPPYRTIVADPPWHYDARIIEYREGSPANVKRLPYSTLTVDEIAALPVGDLAADAAHLYLWATSKYLRQSFGIAEAWGFRPAQPLVWCKPRKGIFGPGGQAFTTTTEFALFCRRGVLPHAERVDSTWYEWPRGAHSQKPAAFLDLVERVSPGPYVELFARAPRLGWDSWGYGYESKVG